MKRTVKFTMDCENFVTGQTVTLDHGVADAFCNWRRVAVFIDEDPPKPSDGKAKSIDTPPANKMVHRNAVLKKAVG